jgi:predicted phage terminase large subunit-like protein
MLGGAGSVLDFVTKVYGPTYTRPDHLAPVADALARCAIGDTRVVLAAPPRHGKSTLVLASIVRFLMLRPQSWVFFVTHSAESAQFRGAELRRLAEAAGVVLRADTQRMGRWETAAGGGVLSSGIGGGSGTGFGCTWLVIDDIYPDRVAADSALVRETTHQQILGTWFNRVTPHGSITLCGVRWHQDDTAGRVLAEDARWENVTLPALDEEGRALWPAEWPAEVLAARRAEVGPYEWQSLFQGAPAPRGASMIKEPATYTSHEIAEFLVSAPVRFFGTIAETRPQSARIILSCDPAVGVKTKNDWSVIATLAARGYGVHAEYRLLDIFRARVEMPRLVENIHRLRQQWGASCVAVECVGGFAGLPSLIRSMDSSLRILPVTPKGDKEFRAESLAAAVAAGRFRVPEKAPWLRTFLDELLAFPSARHDDQVDAVAQGVNVFALQGPPRDRAAVARRIAAALPFGV